MLDSTSIDDSYNDGTPDCNTTSTTITTCPPPRHICPRFHHNNNTRLTPMEVSRRPTNTSGMFFSSFKFIALLITYKDRKSVV